MVKCVKHARNAIFLQSCPYGERLLFYRYARTSTNRISAMFPSKRGTSAAVPAQCVTGSTCSSLSILYSLFEKLKKRRADYKAKYAVTVYVLFLIKLVILDEPDKANGAMILPVFTRYSQ